MIEPNQRGVLSRLLLTLLLLIPNAACEGDAESGILPPDTSGGSVPGQVSNPSPADGASEVSNSAVLGWSAANGASTYDVYLNTSPNLGGAYAGSTSGTSFDPGSLTDGTTYFWRVDAVNSDGTTAGPAWSFSVGISLGSSLAGVLILDPGSDYEVGDEVLFGSTQLLAAGTGAAAFISEVDGAGGVTAVEITHVGQGYEVAPTLSIQTEAGDNCVLLADLRIVEICLANETGTHINGALLLTVPGLFGEASLEFPISAVCFSELGSDECFLAANGTLSLGALEELEVTLFTTTLNEFIEMGDHPIRSREEGMLLVHKIDLDGDGEYEIADGEIIFHTALGAIGLSNATIDAETDAFAADYSGVFDGSFGVSGAIEFYDCD